MAKGYLQDIDFVDFYGRPIITAYADEVGYVVPMKHIIEDHLGLDWTAARKKMNRTTDISATSDQTQPDTVQLFNPILVSGYDLHHGISLGDNFEEHDVPKFDPSQEYQIGRAHV